MIFLLIDDEHQLYKKMYEEVITSGRKDIIEIPRFTHMNLMLRGICRLHFNPRINSHLWLRGKSIWNGHYSLSSYKFDENEQYVAIFMNGTIRLYYSIDYFRQFKKEHPNVKTAMVLYDSSSNQSAKRCFALASVFDIVLSFDSEDCKKYGFKWFNSTLSMPRGLSHDDNYKSSAFFVGVGGERLDLLHSIFYTIVSSIENTKFIINGVKRSQQVLEKVVEYNHTISYPESQKYAFNTDCIVEVIKPNQTGMTLRTCEAIMFNKKLLTNNSDIRKLPFYDERYMSVFSCADDIDLSFLSRNIKVDYKYNGYFSPYEILNIIKTSVSSV